MSFMKNLFGHKEAQDAHNQVYGNNQDYSSDNQQQNQGSFTHEAIAGAAGLAAVKAYEDHVRRTGEQVSHPMMKEMLAGFASAEVDKLFETKGLDYLDKEKAKQMAIQQAHHLAHEKYGSGGVYNGGGSQGQGQGQGQDNYNQGYGGGGSGNYQQGQDNYNQGYGGGNSGNYQQGQSNDYNQGYGGDNDRNQGPGGYQQQNYGGNQGQQQQWDGGNQGQQQQWGGGNDQPRPEHHHHHRREEDN